MTHTTTLLPETTSIIPNASASQPVLPDRLANRGLPASEPFTTGNTANRAWDDFGGTGMTEEYEDGETIHRSDAEENDGASNDTGTAQSEEPCWQELYPSLQSLARYLVNTLPIPYWYGREVDIADDIVQETMCRLLERIRKGQRGEAAPVKIVRHMMTTIAFNYYRDLKRHERRLTRLDQNAHDPNGEYEPINIHIINGITSQLDLDSIAEKVDQEALFQPLAAFIRQFPKKQRQALLIDLANRMSFDEERTPLQAAFYQVGIEMRDYQRQLSTNQRERTQHISLLSQAYKRLKRIDPNELDAC